MRVAYHFLRHLFWMLGKIYLCTLKGDLKNAQDCFYWVWVHLTYKSRFIGRSRLPARMVINNFFIELWGFGATVGIFYGLWVLISKLFA